MLCIISIVSKKTETDYILTGKIYIEHRKLRKNLRISRKKLFSISIFLDDMSSLYVVINFIYDL